MLLALEIVGLIPVYLLLLCGLLAILPAALPIGEHTTRNYFRLVWANMVLFGTFGRVNLYDGHFLDRR